MISYVSQAHVFGISDSLSSWMRGEIIPPKFTYDIQPAAYGFPPGLIPIWSNGAWPGYIGVLKHWFGTERVCSFVRYLAEGQQFIEIARNEEQLRAWLVFEFLSNVPDLDEVGCFAEASGLCAASEVEGVFAECDEASDLLKLEVFGSDPPRFLVEGEAPAPWVGQCTRRAVESSLDAGDRVLTWYLINSPGWDVNVDVVKAALVALEAATREPGFSELVTCWAAMNA